MLPFLERLKKESDYFTVYGVSESTFFRWFWDGDRLEIVDVYYNQYTFEEVFSKDCLVLLYSIGCYMVKGGYIEEISYDEFTRRRERRFCREAEVTRML